MVSQRQPYATIRVILGGGSGTKHLPLLFGKIAHQFGRATAHESAPQWLPPTPYIHGSDDVPSNDSLNSDESDDEPEVPWSGAAMSPRTGSRMSLGDASLGLSFLSSPSRSKSRGKGKDPENGDAMMHDLDEEGSLSERDGLPNAGGVAEGLEADAATEPDNDEPVPPQQDHDV